MFHSALLLEFVGPKRLLFFDLILKERFILTVSPAAFQTFFGKRLRSDCTF